MASELRGVSPGSQALYARVPNKSGQWWNATLGAFENYSSADWAAYVIAMSQQGASQVWVGDFPAAILISGTYEYYVHAQQGSSPAESDPVVTTGKIDWTGQASIAAASGSMTGSDFRDYIVRKGFKRTDKDQEVYEAVTDAIQILRRRFAFDEAEAEIVTTQTIDSSGFKMPTEPDLGLVAGILSERDNNAMVLDRITKSEFDQRYPFMNIDKTYTGLPLVYCVYAGNVYIGPRPDQSDYVYRISYSRRGGTVTSSTVAVPFTALYRDVLCELVLTILYKLMEEYDKAQFHDAEFEKGLALVQRRERLIAGQTYFQQDYRDI